MRVVVTGSQGQVVRSLIERGSEQGHVIVSLGRPELDLAGDLDTTAGAIARSRPQVVVSAAAYTSVDKAESERDLAFAINERGAAAVARAARQLDVPLIHISTDYVFAGTAAVAYRESDPTEPSTVYGASKLAGETAVVAEQPDSAIIRTAWVYSPFGANFVKTMLRLAADRDEVSVVADQRGNPTSALDLADGLLAVANNLLDERDRGRGIFHMTAAGEASWAELAEAVFDASNRLGGPSATVRPIPTQAYPTPARRPGNSRLDCSKIERVHGVRLPKWESSLRLVVSRLVSDSRKGNR